MNEESAIPDDIVDPIEFDLANGSKIRVFLSFFWTKVSELDRRMGAKPVRYFAMRFYSDEDSSPRRIQQIHELFHGKDFQYRFCPKIWRWLIDHSTSRARFDHEAADDFLTVFEEVIDRIHSEDEDMIEHLENLPALSFPEFFDRIDDSIFTDQSDPEIRYRWRIL